MVIKTNTVYAKLAGALLVLSPIIGGITLAVTLFTSYYYQQEVQQRNPPEPRGAHCRRRAAHRRRPDRRGGAQARFPHDDGDQSDHRALPARPRRGNPRLLRSSGKGQALTSRHAIRSRLSSEAVPGCRFSATTPATRRPATSSPRRRSHGRVYLKATSISFSPASTLSAWRTCCAGRYILRTGAWAVAGSVVITLIGALLLLAISLAASPASIGTSGGSGRSSLRRARLILRPALMQR